MIYTKLFDLDTFPWKFKAAKVISKVVEAGKLGELTKALESRFDNEDDTASEDEINDFVAENEVEVLKMCGLDASGKPIGSKRKYKVFLRVTGVVSEEVEAESPEEAADLAPEEFFDTSTDTYAMIDREDCETAVPVAYEDGDGDTKSFDSLRKGGSAEEQEKAEKRNALVMIDSHPWVLVRTDHDSTGHFDKPKVTLFLTFSFAKDEMEKQYNTEKVLYENDDNLSMFQPPSDGEDTCYLVGKDNESTVWHLVQYK